MYGQEEKKPILQEKKSTVNFTDGVFRGKASLKVKISDRLSLENGLAASYNNFYNKIEIPINLEYNIDKNLKVFFGSKLNYLKITNDFSPNINYQNLNLSTQIGINYKFSEKFFIELLYEYGLNSNNTPFFETNNRSMFWLRLNYQF